MKNCLSAAAAVSLVVATLSAPAIAHSSGPHGWQGDRNRHSQHRGDHRRDYERKRSHGCDGHIGADGDCHGTWRGDENYHGGGYGRRGPAPRWHRGG